MAIGVSLDISGPRLPDALSENHTCHRTGLRTKGANTWKASGTKSRLDRCSVVFSVANGGLCAEGFSLPGVLRL